MQGHIQFNSDEATSGVLAEVGEYMDMSVWRREKKASWRCMSQGGGLRGKTGEDEGRKGS